MSASFGASLGGNLRPIGRDRYELSVKLPLDADGMLARECHESSCVPGYFLVKLGTGIDAPRAFCPYCRSVGDPDSFHTKAQLEYAESLAMHEVGKAVDQMVHKALGLDRRGRKRIGGGLLSIDMSYKPAPRRSIFAPRGEELRHDVTCANCLLHYAVYGLASWCPDCGTDTFLQHVDEEWSAIRGMLAAVDKRRTELGNRVAARDLENALEDVVSVFEASIKTVIRRTLLAAGRDWTEVEVLVEKKVRNRLQNPSQVSDTLVEVLGGEPLACDKGDLDVLSTWFSKRHPVTHNLGIIDRRHLARDPGSGREGRVVRLTAAEILNVVRLAASVVEAVHRHVRDDVDNGSETAV